MKFKFKKIEIYGKQSIDINYLICTNISNSKGRRCRNMQITDVRVRK